MERTIGMMHQRDSIPVDRRMFMSMASAGASGLALCLAQPVAALAAPFFEPRPSTNPVLSGPPVGTVFLDHPYVDMSGLAEPYIPPLQISSHPSRAQAWGYHSAFHVTG